MTGRWKKLWHFLWESNSVWSWIANVVIAFVLIKFLIYPGIGLAFSTSHPIVAVVSESMDHRMLYQNNSERYWLCDESFSQRSRVDFDKFWSICGAWYGQHTNISKAQFEQFPFKNGFSRGDIIVVAGKRPERIAVGDVIVFHSVRPYPIIHRVVKVRTDDAKHYFTTKGDHNPTIVGNIGEESIAEERVIGVARFKIPYLGYIKIWFVEIMEKLLRIKIV
jgi:signal peptidase I